MMTALVLGAFVTVVSTTTTDPPNLLELECSLHQLAYVFGVGKVESERECVCVLGF